MGHNSDDEELPDGVGVFENGLDIGDENGDDIVDENVPDGGDIGEDDEDLPDGGHPPCPHPYSSLVTHPC